MEKRKIQSDREFLNLSVPATEEEQEMLEGSLLREGCREPIMIWRGVILDGHKRHKFCSYEEIDFEVRQMDFSSREEAVIWICSRRVPGLREHSAMYRYLVGKWYLCQKKLNKQLRKEHVGPIEPVPTKNRYGRNSPYDTSVRMGEELGVNHSTVEKAGVFAVAMDKIADKEPSLFEAVLREDVHFYRTEILKMAEMDEKQLGEVRRKKLGKKDVKMRRRNKMDAWSRDRHGDRKMENEVPIITGIKEMPAFDPDMVLKGLTLTIPAWVNTIARTERKMDLQKATDKAKENLAENLARLQEQITRMLEVLR